jgi:hypothetical protein
MSDPNSALAAWQLAIFAVVAVACLSACRRPGHRDYVIPRPPWSATPRTSSSAWPGDWPPSCRTVVSPTRADKWTGCLTGYSPTTGSARRTWPGCGSGLPRGRSRPARARRPGSLDFGAARTGMSGVLTPCSCPRVRWARRCCSGCPLAGSGSRPGWLREQRGRRRPQRRILMAVQLGETSTGSGMWSVAERTDRRLRGCSAPGTMVPGEGASR